MAVGGAARNLAAAAQRRAEPAGHRRAGVRRSLPTRSRELVDELAGLCRSPSAGGARDQARPRRHHPRRRADARRRCWRTGGFEALEVTEAGLREGVFLANTLLAGREPLFADVRARRACATSPPCTRPTCPTSSTWPSSRCRCTTRCVDAGLIEPAAGERELLWAAAMLHDVGMAVAYDDHHKHSHYLIMQGELPGLRPPRARADRPDEPLPPQGGAEARRGRRRSREPGDEELLARCAAILRLAEHLERGRDRSVSAVRLRTTATAIDLHLEADGDLTLARWSVERYGDDRSFERVFGRRLLIG